MYIVDLNVLLWKKNSHVSIDEVCFFKQFHQINVIQRIIHIHRSTPNKPQND